MAADHLVDYALSFFDVYSSTPVAAFLSFIDSHEDSWTLARVLDEPLSRLIRSLNNRARQMMIVVMSDHGLHYGPYFQTPTGEKDRSEPMLYIRLHTDKYHSQLFNNSHLWTTPFDVHNTISHALGVQRSALGHSLISPMLPSRENCESAPEAKKFCPSTIMRKFHSETSCVLPASPPSISSFYADIPRRHRPQMFTCDSHLQPRFSFTNLTWPECGQSSKIIHG